MALIQAELDLPLSSEQPKYLSIRGRTWWYRRKVPVAFRLLFGKTEIKKSLRTRDLERAKVLADEENQKIEEHFQQLSGCLAPIGAKEVLVLALNEESGSAFCKLYEHEALSNDEENRRNAVFIDEFDEDAASRLKLMKGLRHAMARGNSEHVTQALMVYQLVKGIHFEGTADALHRLRHQFLISVVTTEESRLRRDEGYIVPTPPIPRLPWVLTKEQERAGVLASYQRWEQANPDVREKTTRDYHGAALEFSSYVSEQTFLSITREDVLAYRGYLRETKGLSPVTINKRLGVLITLSKDIFDQAPHAKSPFYRVKYKNTKGRSTRRSLTEGELNTIFTSVIYSQHQRPLGGAGEAAYWLPLIGLYTGMRLREICQLRLVDIKQDPHSAAWYFDLKDKLPVCDGSASIIQLKRKTSERRVPIHPELLRYGFLHYLKAQGHKAEFWLFPDLGVDRYGDRSAAWSKWWGRWLRQTLQITDPNVVFHSFRHLFKDACREAGIERENRNVIMGHEDQGSTALYGGEVSVRKLAEEMALLTYPFLEEIGFIPWAA